MMTCCTLRYLIITLRWTLHTKDYLHVFVERKISDASVHKALGKLRWHGWKYFFVHFLHEISRDYLIENRKRAVQSAQI
jgi:hypothetical protein